MSAPVSLGIGVVAAGVEPGTSDPASVAITGGTINGATIGGTTAAAITGTTISANTAFRGTDIGTGSTSSLNLTTTGGTQVAVTNTASANRNITLTGSNGGNPAVGTSAGSLVLSPAGTAAIRITATASLLSEVTAIPAGGSASFGYLMSNTGSFGIFCGSGVPTLSAAKGSLYLRSDGSGVSDRAYINTNGGTAWTALTTAG